MEVVGFVTKAVECPARFDRLVTQLFRPHRGYAQAYFDEILFIVALNMVDRISRTILFI